MESIIVFVGRHDPGRAYYWHVRLGWEVIAEGHAATYQAAQRSVARAKQAMWARATAR